MIWFPLVDNLIIPPSYKRLCYVGKPYTVTFLKLFLISTLLTHARFSWTVTGDIHLPLCPDDMVDAIDPRSQAPVAFDDLSTRFVVWFCPVVSQHLSCQPIPDADGQSPASSNPNYCDRWYNRTSDHKEAGHLRRFISDRSTHTENLSWASIPALPLVQKNDQTSATTVIARYCALLLFSHQVG